MVRDLSIFHLGNFACQRILAFASALMDCHIKKTACPGLLCESTRSAIAPWIAAKISSVSSSIGCRSKSADCRVYDFDDCNWVAHVCPDLLHIARMYARTIVEHYARISWGATTGIRPYARCQGVESNPSTQSTPVAYIHRG